MGESHNGTQHEHGCPFWLKNGLRIEGDSWFTWFNQLPGPSIFPKRTPMNMIGFFVVSKESPLNKRGTSRATAEGYFVWYALHPDQNSSALCVVHVPVLWSAGGSLDSSCERPRDISVARACMWLEAWSHCSCVAALNLRAHVSRANTWMTLPDPQGCGTGVFCDVALPDLPECETIPFVACKDPVCLGAFEPMLCVLGMPTKQRSSHWACKMQRAEFATCTPS